MECHFINTYEAFHRNSTFSSISETRQRVLVNITGCVILLVYVNYSALINPPPKKKKKKKKKNIYIKNIYIYIYIYIYNIMQLIFAI